jgi:hypothetical protein
MSTVIHPDPKQLVAMAPLIGDPQCVEAIVERAESHDTLVKRLAKDRFKARITNLDPLEIIQGLASCTVRKHGALLRAAFQESAEAFGDALMSIVVREMELQSEIEAAEIALRIEGAQPKPVRVFRIVGEV